MNSLLSSAIITEGFGNSNLTFRKKVTIEENTFEGQNSVEDIYYFWGDLRKSNSPCWKLKYRRVLNIDGLQDSYGDNNCDHILYRNFGVVDGIELPIFTEKCSRFDAGKIIETPIEEYLVPATYEEIFFAKSCVITNGEWERTISWEFSDADFYHQ